MMAPSSPVSDRDATRPCNGGKSKSRRPNYRRRVKPSDSFAKLIAMAIKESPSGRLTLRGIQAHMSATYECFRGSYVGWKNSVRHNLSTGACFVKVLKDKSKPNGKDNYWALDPDCPHCQMLEGRSLQSTTVAPQSPSASRRSTCKTTAPSPQSITSKSVVPSTTTKTTDSSLTGLPSNEPTLYPSISQDAFISPNEPTVSHSLNPQPLATPSSAALSTASPSSAVNPPSDEWDLLGDLYVPENDIDLSLYNDGGWSCLDNHHTPARQFHQGNYPYSIRGSIEPKGPSASTGSSYLPPCNAQTGLPASYPHVMLPAKMTIKSKHKVASRYHPYDNQMFGNFRRRHEHLADFSYYSVSRHELCHSSEARYADNSRNVPNSFGSDSVVVSAIRNSLDLDEMALCAIEHSVRVLDLTRPCDLMSAEICV